MATDLNEISKRFKLFRNMDPRVYEQQLRLMDQWVDELTVAVTTASPDQILVAQGRAQIARKFLQTMIELPPDEPAQPNPGP